MEHSVFAAEQRGILRNARTHASTPVVRRESTSRRFMQTAVVVGRAHANWQKCVQPKMHDWKTNRVRPCFMVLMDHYGD